MKKVFAVLFFLLCFSSVGLAQSFEEDMGVPTKINLPEQKKQSLQKETQVPQKQGTTPQKVAPTNQPTGSGAKIRRVYKEGEPQDGPSEIIALRMENFKILRFSSNTSCRMRFIILTNLSQNITSLDVKLSWPQMSTSLSFSDIVPNQSTYVDYALLGDGCYTMDSIPNIEVNRCRVKGMTQEQCSSLIRWLR